MQKPNLRINDLFWTFQGEGANWGRRALFVRMPYCNLKCSWCDTQFNSFKQYSEDDFIGFATLEKARFAVLTGGEPSMNKQSPRVIELLKGLGFEVAIETNGTFPLPPGLDFVTISPKRDADFKVHEAALVEADELKFVVDANFDMQILRDFDEKTHGWNIRLSLSPEFGTFKESLAAIYEFIKEHPRWRISLQTHKWMEIP